MREQAEKLFTLGRTTCAALFGIVPLLTFVIWFMFRGGPPETEALDPVMYVMVLVPLVTIVAGPILRAWLVRSAEQGRAVPALTSASSANAAPPDPVLARVAALNQAYIVGMAMGEPAVLIGFVLSFMSGTWAPVLIGGAVTLAYFVVMFPRRPDWEDSVAAAGLGGVAPAASEPPAPL